jgi:hypothetical protein
MKKGRKEERNQSKRNITWPHLYIESKKYWIHETEER